MQSEHRRWRGRFAAAAASLTVLIAALAVVPVQAATASTGDPDDFSFESLEVDYTLTRAEDGTSRMRVVETFVAEFPDSDQNRGMRRAIPESYLGIPLFAEFESVTDEDGDPRPLEVEEGDDALVATSRADEYLHGAQTFVFTYELQNVTRYFEDTGVDEFYWDVNGTEWEQPFGSVQARLHLEGALADALTGDAACYVGEQGSTQECTVVIDDSATGAVVRAGADDVGAGETVTMAVAFEEGTFTPFDTSPWRSPFWWLQLASFAGALAAVIAAAVVRARRLGDAPGRPTVIAEYAPPRGIDALESAVLMGQSSRGIPAEVLEQAIAGSIRVVEGPRKWGKTTFDLQLIDRSRADENGRELLDGMFAGGRTEYRLGRSDSRLSRTASGILKDAAAQLRRDGLRRRVPGHVRALPIVVAVAAAVGVFAFGITAMSAGVDPLGPLLLIVAAGIMVFVVAALVSRTPLTPEGAEARDHLRGVKMFIEWAEADRIRMLQSPAGAERRAVSVDDSRQMLRLYERLLPYAVVFGQETEWAKRLAFYYEDSAPGWYFGHGAFNAAAFSASVASLSTVSASSTASSTGGSAGGGSAGGGGGGGGGGGV
ncbi:DUF2207 domain-containing protein [Microbacterium sp. LRZ72]|uniref:DUF2207 family protein n=1 Tax=Microbacterium sp. LRZ72 TaxID=2942481 RepID=UPI0029A17F06|nr:DUF2207 domain-containing protein [Microbacterium sp. LRZ72]MDX2376541.1 DUF2207 domain-containing protein [Microbacterium sp. LRZ72]